MDVDTYPKKTYREVAELLGITRQAVHFHEKTALRKLRTHPVMVKLANEYGILPEKEQT